MCVHTTDYNIQTGDVFDRGHHDLEVEEWLYRLKEDAEAAGNAKK
jgi:hypothetical protein